ncbi:hypothetical protein Cgig2_025664 [Carnegiea gigantea]|uniref:Uncharacterized protein n=1 Tax=Carnegiea gigantea TaxID=171969 RepID=A0A9Q1KM19_9CARY|nr:hypothetical protein Cgig2_025664 [Carnegiea gigantea]
MLIFTHCSRSSSSSPTPTLSPFTKFHPTQTGGSSLVVSPLARSTFLIQSQLGLKDLHIVLGLDEIDPVLEAESDKDNDFVDDGDIEVFHDSSEEEEEEFDYDMSQDEAYMMIGRAGAKNKVTCNMEGGVSSLNLVLRMTNQTGKRKRMSKFTGMLTMSLDAQEAVNPFEVEVDPMNVNFEHDRPPRRASVNSSANSAIDGNVGNNEATSKIKKKGERGKYKSYIVDMKIKGKQSKLSICIPDETDRAIGDNARHLGQGLHLMSKIGRKLSQRPVMVCGRKYRIWKTHLYYYYKSPSCGNIHEECMRNPPTDLPQDQWEYCVKHFSFVEFKRTYCYVFVDHPSPALLIAKKGEQQCEATVDVIWLAEHTRNSDEEVLQGVGRNRSNEIHVFFLTLVNLKLTVLIFLV